jgi:hypothetical protein
VTPFDVIVSLGAAKPLAAAVAKPAGGAALDQVAIATGGALVASLAVLWMIRAHRTGTRDVLDRGAASCARLSGLPGWAALPIVVATVSLHVALLGMYWDIALHIGEGRDEGPLANPAHYLILAGLYGVFCSGVLAMALPRGGERPGPAAVRLTGDWWAPVGGLLIAAAGAFALIGFPLDDLWHRLFGQDVTLWGPTHLMLIGGAGMTLIGQAVLVAEGLAARTAQPRATARRHERIVTARRVALMGGLLIGLSTFQAEYDFGVPQFRLVLGPLLVAVAAGVALVAARLWAGRGGAIGAALFFLAIRGGVSLLVGPVLGEITPVMPLYLGAAVCVELAGLALARRPLALGAAGGLLAGTAGIAAEWPWTRAVMDLPWSGAIVPEGLILAALGGLAGGVLGALLAQGLKGALPRPALARGLVAGATLVIAACVVDGLVTQRPQGARVAIVVRGDQARVRVEPAGLAADPAWVTVTAWQGGGLHVDRLRRVATAEFVTTKPVPLDGEWKTVVRVQTARHIVSAPLWMPEDPAIPAKAVPVPSGRAEVTRTLAPDHEVLQRERKQGVAGWLWAAAGAVVLALSLAFLVALSWGVGRIGRATDPAPRRAALRRRARQDSERGPPPGEPLVA